MSWPDGIFRCFEVIVYFMYCGKLLLGRLEEDIVDVGLDRNWRIEVKGDVKFGLGCIWPIGEERKFPIGCEGGSEFVTIAEGIVADGVVVVGLVEGCGVDVVEEGDEPIAQVGLATTEAGFVAGAVGDAGGAAIGGVGE